MKKRISIYIDEGVWDKLKEAAWVARKSASAYLGDVINGVVDVPELIADDVHEVRDKLSKAEDMLRKVQGQAELDAARAAKEIKSDTIERSRERIQSLTGHVGGFSKNKQVGKKR